MIPGRRTSAPTSSAGPSGESSEWTWSSAARLFVSAALAAAVAALIDRTFPRHLHVATDVIGYPIFRDFNIDRYFHVYYLVAIVFPLATLLAYHGLSIAFPPRAARARPAPAQAGGTPAIAPGRKHAAAIARLLFVGLLVGLFAGVSAGRVGAAFWTLVLAAGGAYAAVSALVATGLGGARRRPSAWPYLAAANASAIPLLVLGLYGASAVTRVTVESTGAVRAFPWLPAWVALPAALGLLGIVVARLAAAQTLEAVRRVERRAILLIAVPAAVFLFHAELPGPVATFDAFHDGEALVPATLVRTGALPWRDILFIHGPLYDVLRPLTGIALFDDSRWGLQAAESVLWGPAWFVALYFLNAYLFASNWLFLALTVTVGSGGLMAQPQLRFLLQPFAFLLLAALLTRASAWRGLAFTALLVVQAILTPESAYTVAACGTIVMAYELRQRRRGRPVIENFRRTLLCLGWGTVLALGFLAILWRLGALQGFVDYFRTFAPGHRLAGGIPIVWSIPGAMPPFAFAVFAPIVCVLLAFWYFVARLRLGRPIPVPDWVMGAAAVFWLLYYTKFIGRADGHVYQVLFAAPTLLYYVVYKAVSAADAAVVESAFGRGVGRLTRHPVTLMLACGMVAIMPVSPPAQLARLPGQLHARVPAEPQIARLGFAAPTALDVPIYDEVEKIVDFYVRPGDRIFDFTNQPGILYYLLGRRPVTRYYHATMASREVVQEDLVRELTEERPEFVVFYNEVFGLWNWDGIPNMVRHYDVSQYLLQEYRPFLGVRSYVFLARPDVPLPPGPPPGLAGAPVTDPRALYFRTRLCDWGYAPNFLELSHAPRGPAVELGVSPTAGPPVAFVQVRGWAIDRAAGVPAVAVLVVGRGEVLATIPVGESRPDVAQAFGNWALLHSGFEGALPLGSRPPSPLALHVLAVSARGVVSELPYSTGSPVRAPAGEPVASVRLAGRGDVPVTPGVIGGFVDVTRPTLWYTTVIEVPPALRHRGYGVIEVRQSRWAREDFSLSDDPTGTDARRAIAFKSLSRPRVPFRVPVASCSQWYGYEGARLYLRHTRPHDRITLRLLPGPLDRARVLEPPAE